MTATEAVRTAWKFNQPGLVRFIECQESKAKLMSQQIEYCAALIEQQAAAVKKVEDFDLVVVMNKKLCSELDAAKARVAAYKKALDIAMSTNQSHETYCKVEAALEEKP